MRRILLIALAAVALVPSVSARDKVMYLDIADVLAPSYSEGKLDGSVKFFFADQPTPTVVSQLGTGATSRKTSSMSRTDADACRWAMLTALLALQEQAKSMDANAVIGINSNYNNKPYASQTQFECHAGNVMVGVALKGRYAKVSGK